MSLAGNKITKNFYLFSFLPALAYWYLEENHTLQIAVFGGIILALLEIILEYIFVRHIHSLSKLNFLFLCVLGPISLIGEDGLWFKLQPMFTGISLYCYFFYLGLKGESLLWTMSNEMNGAKNLPKPLLLIIERHMAFFLLIYGLFMGMLAKYYSTSTWAFFKTIGFYLSFFAFMIFELFYIKFFIIKKMTNENLEESHRDKNQ